jgi:glycosyltransferase involved in cell wall biosynthesis
LDLSSVIVVIPALNEERSLPRVLTDLPAVGGVIVVDNNSTDRTADVARAGGAEVVAQPERGYGAACLAGIARAQERGAGVLVILDADYSDYSEDIGLLVGPVLRGEADLVMGDRTANAQRGSLAPQQRIGNTLATYLIARSTGHRYRDMGPFRAIRMTSLLALQMEDRTWGWNVEMQMKALHHKMRVLEVPVRYRPRIGKSKISGTIQGTLRAGARILLSVRRYRS